MDNLAFQLTQLFYLRLIKNANDGTIETEAQTLQKILDHAGAATTFVNSVDLSVLERQ